MSIKTTIVHMPSGKWRLETRQRRMADKPQLEWVQHVAGIRSQAYERGSGGVRHVNCQGHVRSGAGIHWYGR